MKLGLSATGIKDPTMVPCGVVGMMISAREFFGALAQQVCLRADKAIEGDIQGRANSKYCSWLARLARGAAGRLGHTTHSI